MSNSFWNPTIEVEIRETISKTIQVNAPDEASAVEKAVAMYNKGDISLDEIVYADVQIKSLGIVQKVFLMRPTPANNRPTIRMVI